MKFGGLTTALALRTARKRSQGRTPAPTVWEKANTDRDVIPRVRLRDRLDAADTWWDSHPILVRFLWVTVIVSGVVAAVNLQLGRPWF